ncbi:phage tail-collar fiber domain-containing protein [Vibrio sp. HA2012]|uniref:phage tail-collar fiber domain-containing protein n=1 Tax=Vibrio sp. HA2012 TaxID=1971595 RepID=UPI001E5B1073|nr:phage tail protein [Vibrio sp. HA2012]
MSLLITDAGISASIAAGDLGISYKITHISIGTQGYIPTSDQTALKNEIQRKAITRGELVAPGQLHFETVWDGTEEFEGKELGYWLENGTLFAVDSRDGEVITFKRKNTIVTEACALNLAASTIENITVELQGSPYASEALAGIAKIATTTLVSAGSDDTTIVTPKKLKERMMAHKAEESPHAQYPLATKTQGLEYDPDRIYYRGDTCYTRVDNRTYEWEAYHSEPFSGKDPGDEANRQVGWTDDNASFYWTPAKKARPGTPLWPWFSKTVPEGTLNVLGNSVPVAVFWRLAEAFPEFVNTDTAMIDFPDTGGEFFRVLDQGRGINAGRVFSSLQLDAFQGHKHLATNPFIVGGSTGDKQNGNLGSTTTQTAGTYNAGYGTPRIATETRPRNLAFPILVEI